MDLTQTSASADQIRVHVLIPAAGRGVRFGTPDNKIFAPLNGRPVIAHTVERFLAASISGKHLIDGVTVIGRADELSQLKSACQSIDGLIDPRLSFCAGGSTRQESVLRGLQNLNAKSNDIVLVHDGARPLVPLHVIQRCIENANQSCSAIAACPITETVKRSAPDNIIAETVDRNNLWTAQTPQAATYGTLIHAFQAAESDRFTGTDEASLLERVGVRPTIVMGARENIKITTPDDLAFAERIMVSNAMSKPQFRVGTGYDIHRLVVGRPLVLGGMTIQSDVGLLGHSDADVLLHALCDALLGAAGLPDIGHLFPNDDSAYKDADSIELLKIVRKHITDAGYGLGNVDCSLIAERPKIAPYILEMRANIASALEIEESQIGIKATTNEGLGSLGAGEGIAAHAVATIFKFG